MNAPIQRTRNGGIYHKEIEMRKLIANEFMTLDGVVQAPSYADEDTTAGFEHGGWHAGYFDELSMSWVVENQDRSRWDRDLIAEGLELVSGAWSKGSVGEYLVQAQIAALHD